MSSVIANFFVLSPRGDTILSKMYRVSSPSVVAHERSHTEAFLRKVRFWDGMTPMGGAAVASSPEFASTATASASQSTATHSSSVISSSGLSSSTTWVDGAESTEMGGGSGGGGEDHVHTLGGKKRDAPPVFLMPDGLNYVHIKRNGLLFACSSPTNVSPCTVIELLTRISKVFKDYCGTLSEEAIRKNFILLYELLDEMLDYGYPQTTRTEHLKAFVYNEPILVTPAGSTGFTGSKANSKTASATAVQKPVISSITATGRSVNVNAKNEIFVDILERLNVLFSPNGHVLNSTIDGCIQMKSYLAGNPELRLALNEDLVIGRPPGTTTSSTTSNYGKVILDDVTFHDCVNLSEFELGRVVSFYPPDGEFVAMQYRLTGDYSVPFRIFPAMEETGPKSLDLTILVRAEMDPTHFGANVIVEVPLPRCTATATFHILSASGPSSTLLGSASSALTSSGSSGSSSHAEFIGGSSGSMTSSSEKKVIWTIKKFPGTTEQTIKIKLTLDKPCTSHIRREIGPIHMNFEIPMFNVSNLQVRYMRIAENIPGYTPYRWVRYVTQSSSYVCRL